MLNLNRYVISPQFASQTLVCYLLVDDLVFCSGSKDEVYYVYDVMRSTLREQQYTLHDDRYNQLRNFQRAWHWVPQKYWNVVYKEMNRLLNSEADWDDPSNDSCQYAIKGGTEKMITALINNTEPIICGNAPRIFISLANRRVSGDELTKGLKALNIESEVKIQSSYLGGWNIEGYTIESFMRHCAERPSE